ncbi:unnamed protein product [Closterium sp. Naga37s-1]|nr:unnamed protein product [Closterium sp. Naga37s-1]
MALLRASRSSLACFPQALAIAVVAFVLFAIGSLAAAHPSIRGVAPQDVAYFSGSEVRCRDGSRSVAVQRVNDDFCDCADGTDEPGTSACALARFYCANRGHMPLTLFSSRVNDGICDCCDGSDEYASGAGCSNTCVQMGAETRTQLVADVAAVREGVKLRGKAVVGHVALRDKWEREVTELEERRAQLVEQEKALKARKEELERQEGREKAWRARLEREQHARDALVAHTRPLRTTAASSHGSSGGGGDGDSSGDEGGESGGGGGEEQVAAEAEALWTGAHGAGGAGGADGADGGNGVDGDGSSVEGAGSEEKGQGEEGAAGGEGEGGSEDFSGLSKEEMGRRIASRWTGGGEGGQQHEEHSGHVAEHSGHVAEHSGHVAEHAVEDEGLPPPDVGYGDPDAVQSGDDDHDHDDDHDYSGNDDDEYKEDANNEDEDYNKDDEEDVDGDAESEGEEEAADLEQDMGAGGGEADEGKGGAGGDKGVGEEEDEEEGEVSVEELKQLEEFNPDDPPAVTPVSVWLARTLHWPMAVCSRLYSLAAPTPPLTLNASRVEAAREEHRGVEEQLRKARSRAKVVKDKLKRDYGPHGEFSNLVDRCFSFNANQHFKRFEEEHTVMAFEDGEHCWNGPARSIKVRFKCGADVAVLAVDEPNRCEYAATMTTPSVCTEEKAKELEQQLEAMLRDIHPAHDEL